ncbi:MAG: AAA family ATPase [Clostridia bacterium]|nr:AAA family ATPase [Clostridia bacterium]
MIQLTKATLTTFGKFKNKTIPFNQGFQIIYGGNEAGKSTLQLFIRAMLYGLPNQRKTAGLLLRDRERIIPWGEKYAEGVLSLTADGKSIEIYRRFGKTPAGDKMEIRDAGTGEPIPGYQSETVGELLFGVSAELFEKTFWFRQDSVFPIGTDEELSQKLRNLQESGEEDISAQDTLDSLKQQKKALRAKDKRETPGLLDILFKKKDEKLQEKYQLESEWTERKNAETTLENAKKRLADANGKLETLQKLEETRQRLQSGQAKATKWKEAERLRAFTEELQQSKPFLTFSSLTEETLEKAESLKRKIETLDRSQQIGYDKEELHTQMRVQRKRKKAATVLMLLGGIVMISALILGVMRVSFWKEILLDSIPVCVFFLGLGLYFFRQGEKGYRDLLQKEERVIAMETDVVLQVSAYKKELGGILTAFGCETLEELQNGFSSARTIRIQMESYRTAYQKILEDENPDELRQCARELESVTPEEKELLKTDISGEIQKLRSVCVQAVSEMKELEGKLSYEFHGGKTPANVDMELALLEEEIAEANRRLSALELAESVFASVCEKRKTEFAPKVNEKVNAFLKSLSAGKYGDVRISDSFRMRLGMPGGETAEAEYFSRGTYEQMYLALRLSLCEFSGNGDEPMFLDDVLTSFDDTRTEGAMQVLKQLGECRQMILFTCHRWVRDLGNTLSAEIYDLEEELTDGC